MQLANDVLAEKPAVILDSSLVAAGIDGMYDFKANPERGLGPDSSTVVRYDAKEKAWTWLTRPGGEPLQ